MTSLTESPSSNLLDIEVVFATAKRQELISLRMPAGSTVADAIAESGLATLFASEFENDSPVGVWGKLARADQVLKDGDRVEIYRPLHIDPREARRLLAEQGRSMNEPGLREIKDRD